MVDNQIDIFKRILNTCLGVEDEQVLILGDKGTENHAIAPTLTDLYTQAAKDLNLNSKTIYQEPRGKGQSADNEVIYALADLPKKSTIVLNMSSGLGRLNYLGKSFRTFAKSHQHRFISSNSWLNLPSTAFPQALNSLSTDYEKMRDSCNVIKEQLDPGKILNITTNKGTDLSVNIYGKKGINNHGIYTSFGTGGNVPAGEVYLPPRARKKNFGTVVIDGTIATMEGSIFVKDPVKLIIENSEIVDIHGKDEASLLQKSIDWAQESSKHPWGVKRLCEIGIGCNPDAVLSGATIIDEKVKGTAHVAQGSNHWFGGTIYSIIHYDHVFKEPHITIDDIPLKIP